jgi:hypothetical protein
MKTSNDNGDRSRLLFSSTAEMRRPGGVEVSLVGVGLPQVEVGITPSVSVGAGLSVAPGWFGEVFLAAPKVQVWSQGAWSLALDARTVLAKREVGPLGERDTRWEVGSVPQVIGSVHLPRSSVTLGVGIPWNTMGFRLKDPAEGFGNTAAVRVTAGADLDVNSWMRLLTENYVYVGVTSKEAAHSAFRSIQSETVVESLNGARFHGAGLALNVALGMDTEGVLFSKDRTDVFPYLRFSYRF